MLKLPPALLDAVKAHGEESYPFEGCGILLGSFTGDHREVAKVVRCRNIRTDSPRNRYSIDPAELVRVQREARDLGLEIVGFYHSHPDHPARWSSTDFAEAHWIGYSYLITSVEGGRATESNSFVLTGRLEEDKAFRDEQLVIT